jgi:hypothetical protein
LLMRRVDNFMESAGDTAMKRELEEEFNQKVEGYRKALLYYARQCDWETFEAKAGNMFDYVESVEFRELERRFFTTFNLILGVLILAVIGFLFADFGGHQEWIQLKSRFLFSGIAVCSFELYFYLDYRIYLNVKTNFYPQRRKRFIKGIEQDFRGLASVGSQ